MAASASPNRASATATADDGGTGPGAAVEPNRHFHRRLRRAADDHRIDLVLHPTEGEHIDVPDDSVDAAVASWVLCTVADPAAVLAEIRRVLRPGGRFVFIEHMHAPEGTAVRRVQDVVFRPWRWLFEGCHTTRATERIIRSAGFAAVGAYPVHVGTPFVPLRTQIAGVAVA
jgi:ubiquinone/menaquinone biosynthesis C-methylase UbiE